MSLVQLGTIVDSLSRLARSIAPALGSQPSSQTVAVCLIVGFAIAGLLAGWTGTRIHLATAINQSDLAIDLIRQAKLASQNGDEETAELLKDQAAEILISLQPISSEYESLRSAVQPSTHRTEQMKMLFDELRDVLRPIVLDLTTVSNLLDSSSDSSRLIGLAYLETHKEEVDTLRILKVIQTSHSAFEQNNALRLLRAKLELQDWADDDATQISSALERIHFTPRSERKQIARDITERLTDQTLNL
ncbi:hypothetical protein RD149_17185 [Gordonia westfalica]|uniref:Uncharacterized protein n=1 Tax=Gordonia westfalica TaxID=158898 RepID=A0ABU2GVM1_9ACTN|nr:hypothetical protein [Gordonia westfalica]MDS1115491.1 hypothetical protein [Gordonia westfalica]